MSQIKPTQTQFIDTSTYYSPSVHSNFYKSVYMLQKSCP